MASNEGRGTRADSGDDRTSRTSRTSGDSIADAAESVGDAAETVEDAAKSVEEQPAFQAVARGGFLMGGLVHVLIGWMAVRLALGDSGGSADQNGAMAMIAQAPGGRLLLWVGGLVMAILALWFLLRTWFAARRGHEVKAAVVDALRWSGPAAVYAGLSGMVLRFAAGGGSSSSAQTQSATAGLLGSGPGRALVLLAGAVVIGIGIGFVVVGVTRRFLLQLVRRGARSVGAALRITGIVGYIAKGFALTAVGVLLGWAAISADPEKATGLDGALTTMAGLPAGVAMLLLIGVGLILFGVHSALRSRYQAM